MSVSPCATCDYKSAKTTKLAFCSRWHPLRLQYSHAPSHSQPELISFTFLRQRTKMNSHNASNITPVPSSAAVFGGLPDSEPVLVPPPLGLQSGTLIIEPGPQAAAATVSMPTANPADVAAVEQAVDCMDQPNIDFKNVSLNDLLSEINPRIEDDLRDVAPDVLAGLANFQDYEPPVQQQTQASPLVVSNPPMQASAPVHPKSFVAQPAQQQQQQQQAQQPQPQQTVPAHVSAPLASPIFAAPNNSFVTPAIPNTTAINPTTMLPNVPTPAPQSSVSQSMNATAAQAGVYTQNLLPRGSEFPNQYPQAMYGSAYVTPSVIPCTNNLNTSSINGDNDPRSIRNTRGATRMSMNDPAVMQAMAAFNFKEESTIATVVPVCSTPTASSAVPMAPNQMMPGMVGVMPVPVARPPATYVVPRMNGSMVSPALQMTAPQTLAQQQLASAAAHPQKLATQVAPVIARGGGASTAAAAGTATRIVPQVGVTPTNARSSAAEMLAKEEEERKIIRAERNRHSAAASRERKKQYLNELERRVAILSRRNAQLQIEQIRAVARRVERERELQAENERLKVENFEMDMKMSQIEDRLESLGIGESPYSIERRELIGKAQRPKTYDHGVASWRAAVREAEAREEEFDRMLEEQRRKKMLGKEEQRNV